MQALLRRHTGQQFARLGCSLEPKQTLGSSTLARTLPFLTVQSPRETSFKIALAADAAIVCAALGSDTVEAIASKTCA